MLYADLIIPVPLQKLFTYSVPPSMESVVRRGCRVLVQFGKKKFYSGIVMRVHSEAPAYETKPISEIVDTEPIVTERQLQLWQWIADYYICTMGEVMKAAMPQGLKLESESRLMYNALFEEEVENCNEGDNGESDNESAESSTEYDETSPTAGDGSAPRLTPRQREVLDFIRSRKACTISDVANALDGANPMTHIRALLEMEAIYISEELRDAYKPRTVDCWTLSPALCDMEQMSQAMEALERRAPKQMESLMAFLQAAGGMGKAMSGVTLTRDALADKPNISFPALANLTAKGILTHEKRAVSRLAEHDAAPLPPNALSDKQAEALESIKSQGNAGKPVLLHGVTGSGKTEIYIHLMAECLAAGRNVLYLLPEIALTTQITDRLRRHFGNDMVVYHSKFSDSERVEVWKRMLGPEPPRIVLGVRSSVLLPLPKLGLVIVDEEHEGSYKQYDPAPRYNARDMAVVLALQANAKLASDDKTSPRCMTLLGSATPSLESWNNAQTGKYALVELNQRHQGLELPKVETINMTEARHRKEVNGIFSLRMRDIISQALGRKEQIILFQNRRGFAPVVECQLCAMVPKCEYCDVSLTYHKSSGQLVCHYCGFSRSIPTTCPSCGNPSLRPQGFGTEKIEEECKTLFPDARVARMDLDTARSRKSFEEIIAQFADRKHDILIGTQMVTKGLDFEGVSTVGVMNADNLLNMPDFRADERSYQLLTQVSGRAGRKGKQGQVFIQTGRPEHPVVQNVKDNDYAGNAARLMKEREAYGFPPFTRLISLTVKHRDQQTDLYAARTLAQMLGQRFGSMVYGPIQPVVSRVSSLYLQEITLKIPRQASPAQVKSLMMEQVNALLAEERFRSVTVRIDVDPY